MTTAPPAAVQATSGSPVSVAALLAAAITGSSPTTMISRAWSRAASAAKASASAAAGNGPQTRTRCAQATPAKDSAQAGACWLTDSLLATTNTGPLKPSPRSVIAKSQAAIGIAGGTAAVAAILAVVRYRQRKGAGE